MKKINTLLQIACIGLFAMACSDDPASVSPEKAQAAFSNANDNIAADLAGLQDAPGFVAMESLSDLNGAPLPFGRMKSFERTEVKNQIQAGLYAIRSVLVGSTAGGRVSGDVEFDYESKKGVYTYNFTTEEFDYSDAGNIVEIHFPATEGALTNEDNNGVFKLTAYTEEYTPNGDDLYSPTTIEATVDVDGTLMAKIDLDVDYGSDDEMVKADIFYFVSPYTVDLSFDDTKSTSTSFAVSLLKDSKVVIGAGMSVTFQTSAKEDPSTISGYVQLMNIKFIVSANANNPNAEDINDIISISIKIDGGNAGKVVFEDDGMGSYTPYIRYNDGTTQLLSEVFEDLALQLGELDLDIG